MEHYQKFCSRCFRWESNWRLHAWAATRRSSRRNGANQAKNSIRPNGYSKQIRGWQICLYLYYLKRTNAFRFLPTKRFTSSLPRFVHTPPILERCPANSCGPDAKAHHIHKSRPQKIMSPYRITSPYSPQPQITPIYFQSPLNGRDSLLFKKDKRDPFSANEAFRFVASSLRPHTTDFRTVPSKLLWAWRQGPSHPQITPQKITSPYSPQPQITPIYFQSPLNERDYRQRSQTQD
jgi:hypothetical protein